MSELHQSAKLDYVSGLKYKEIAEKYGVTINTVKSWKQRHGWSREKGALTEKSVHTKQAGVHRVHTAPQASEISGELTDKQRTFVMEYMRDFNATRAAIAVGYSKKTAYSIGWELLRKPEIQAEIKRLKELLADELGLDIRRIISEYMKIAFTDITDLLEFGQREVPVMTMFGPMYEGEGDDKKPVTKQVNYVDFRPSSEIDGTVIAEVKQGKEGVSIKLHDKMRALEKLDRYIGYMTDEEKLRLAKLQAEVKTLEGPKDETPDDGFIEALRGKTSTVWQDEMSEEKQSMDE